MSDERLDDGDKTKRQRFRQLRQSEHRRLGIPPIGPDDVPVGADNDDDEGGIPVVDKIDDDDESAGGDDDEIAPDSPRPRRSERLAGGARRNPRFYNDDWVNAFTVRDRQR